MITYLSITVLLWPPSSCYSTLLSSSHHVPARSKSDTWVCIEIALIFTQWLLSASQGSADCLRRSCGVATGGGGAADAPNGAQSAGTALTQLPPCHTSAASLLTLTGGRLRAKISSHFLTEGQRDTVLRMNGHVMSSML